MTAVTAAEVSSQLPRALVSIESVKDAVSKIISEVQSESLKALQRHALEFDGLKLVNFRVPTEKLSQALDELDEGLRQAIEISIERVRKVSEATLPKSVSIEVAPGGYVDQHYVPIDSVGLYAPGGKAVYPSSVVMNVVPAQVAKVPRIAVTSPAQADGRHADGGRPGDHFASDLQDGIRPSKCGRKQGNRQSGSHRPHR